MDNFMDKLAQRLTAQEMIKANSAADAAELERLQKQLAQYDACLQEMRKLSLKNVEATDKIGSLLDESIAKIQAFETNQSQNESLSGAMQEQTAILNGSIQSQKIALTDILEAQKTEQKESMASMEQSIKEALENSRIELNTLQEEIKSTMEGMASMDGLDEKSNELAEFVHKENVKVYRNVQAVVVEETKKQTESLEASQKKMAGKNKSIMAVSVITLLAVLANLAWNLLTYFQIL